MKEELRILIVEDVPADALLEERALRQAGLVFQAKRVETEDEFTAEVETFKPDAILADYNLPSFDGMAALAIAKEKCPEVPFIVVTGSLGDERAVETLKQGATDYVLKDRLVKLPLAVKRALEEASEHARRKQAEEALRQSEERYRTMVNAVTTYTYSVDLQEGRAVSTEHSAGCIPITGYDPQDYESNPLLWHSMIHPEDRAEVEATAGEVLAGGTPPPVEYRIVRRDMRTVWVRNTMVPHRNPEGTLLGYDGLVENIDERKRAEEQTRLSHQKLRVTFEKTISALASALEKRDAYTSGHQRRVSELAQAIGLEMGLPGEMIDGIRMSGVIHDLGKIAIPAEILSKPSRLSDTEFSLIKVHPQVGYDILKDIEFPWPLADIIHQHHERIDGSGYPQGLSDGGILLEAKIMAVADVVEAIASHRPYRPALGIEKALEEIAGKKGVFYDPMAVDACLRLFCEKRFILTP
jgi:PAS domain S-box-containing protein